MSSAILGTFLSVGVSAMNASKQRNAMRDAQGNILSADEAARYQQQQQYEQTRRDWAPQREAGHAAVGRISDVMGGDMSSFRTSPGYNWRLGEGRRNVENAFSTKGGGGNAMRALMDYGQNMASNEFGNWFDRNLATAGLGTTGNAYTQQAGTNAANNISMGNYRTGDNLASLGMYGANQQSAYNNQMLGGLLTGFQQIYDKNNRGGGGYGGISNPSDLRLKENIQPLAEVNGLNLYSWEWNDTAKSLGVNGPTFGVMAQEVMKDHPDAVSEDKHGYLRVDYSKLLGDK